MPDSTQPDSTQPDSNSSRTSSAGSASGLLRPSQWPITVTAFFLILLAVSPNIVQALDHGYLVSTLTRAIIFGIAAMSLDLAVGYGGMVSLGHAAYIGVGFYTAGALTFHKIHETSFLGFIPGTSQSLITWPLAMIIGALVGLLIGSLALRTKGVYFIMATLAFNQMIFFLFNSLSIYGGDDGTSLKSVPRLFGPIELTRKDGKMEFFYICFGILVVVTVLLNLVVRSPFGRVLRGCKDNEARMQALGYKTFRYRLAAFVISASLCSLAGAMEVGRTQFLLPKPSHWTESGILLVVATAGGLGTLIGGVVGTVVLFLLESFISDVTNDWEFYVGLGLIVIVIAAPKGIVGWFLRGNRNV